jgi:D-sedoheptulose 7-phosphate isomerase
LDRISSIVSDSIEVKRKFFEEHKERVVSAASIIAASFRQGGKLLICGNGGSSTDAQHIAGELVNRFLNTERPALPALALSTDGGLLTSISNDTGFDQVFSRQIEAFGRQGDILLAISTSGNSANTVEALKKASLIGMKTIGLLGRDGGLMAPLCDLTLIVSSSDTQRIQETHNLIAHILCELIEIELFPNK